MPHQRRPSAFLSTPSARRATGTATPEIIRQEYFYPRPPRGGRPFCNYDGTALTLFLSTPSARRATTANDKRTIKQPRISIHALREEGDGKSGEPIKARTTFLSTPSARRATGRDLSGRQQLGYFYPRPPRGGRRPRRRQRYNVGGISIHALREEGDSAFRVLSITTKRFLSTPSARRATNITGSIMSLEKDFYPRPPRGGRLVAVVRPSLLVSISIHALREEGDLTPRKTRRKGRISIHALREEGDPLYSVGSWNGNISIHALREEGDCRRSP